MSHSPEAPPKSDSVPQRICPLCGEANPPDRRECWNCAEPLPSAPVSVVPFSVPALVLALAWLTLLCWLIYYSPGLAIAQVILTTPPVVRTVILARKRAALGRQTGVAHTLEMSVLSFGATLLILVVALICAFAAFFTVCLGVAAAINFLPGVSGVSGTVIGTGVVLGLVGALAAGIGAARAFRRLIVRRWNDDLNRK